MYVCMLAFASAGRGQLMSDTAAQAWFIAGAGVIIAAGALHMWMALVDAVRPSYFVPKDRSLRPAMESVQMRFGGTAAPSMWRVWRGIHVTHSLGLLAFGAAVPRDRDLRLRAGHEHRRHPAARDRGLGRVPRDLAALLLLRPGHHHRHRYRMLRDRHRAVGMRNRG